MDHLKHLADKVNEGKIPHDLAQVIKNFFETYVKAIVENGYVIKDVQSILNLFIDVVVEQLASPYEFEPFHECIRSPIDYYQFGLDLLRPLVLFSKSQLVGLDQIDNMEKAISSGENVILLANHQTEPDPQAISLMLEKSHPLFAEKMIFVAGHRVISDPLAAPFSKGRNLLCIFSKRYVETEPELKQEKLSHNQRTMKKMMQLLSEGGKCIYVAPSGGRDRPSSSGIIEVAPFDPQSIEMFWLMAKQSGRKTHFHPLALSTYNLLPPPSSIESDLGENRHTYCTPIHLAFGSEIDMDQCVDPLITDKKLRRKARAEYIWQLVVDAYTKFL